MKKISTAALSLLMGLTAANSNAITFASNDNLVAAQARAAEGDTAKVLEAIGTGNSVLIAPRLIIAAGNVTPSATGLIEFKNAAGDVIDSAQIIDSMPCPSYQSIQDVHGTYYDPGANYTVYLLDKPITAVKPIALDKRKKSHFDDELVEFKAYFTGEDGAKIAVDFRKSMNQHDEMTRAGQGTFFRLAGPDDVVLENKDAGAPLIHIEDDAITLSGLWSSSPNAANLQQDAHNFTLLAGHDVHLRRIMDKHGPLRFKLAENSNRAKPYLVRQNGTGDAGNWCYGAKIFDTFNLEEGEYSFLAAASGKQREEIVIVNKLFEGGALKIDNNGQDVRVIMRSQEMNVTAIDTHNTRPETESTEHGYVFKGFPYGEVTLTFTIDGHDPIVVTYHHKEN